MGCGGCGKNNNFADKPMFTDTGPKNDAMKLLMKRNGLSPTPKGKAISLTPEVQKELQGRKQNILMNLGRAAIGQKSPFKWLRSGISGIIKCLEGDHIYDDEGIKSNRDVCRTCEYATKDVNGNLTMQSQCMAPDKDGAPCACFITCLSSQGTCKLDKWTALTINRSDSPKSV